MSSMRKAMSRKACSSEKPDVHSVKNISFNATAAPTNGDSLNVMRARYHPQVEGFDSRVL